MAIVFMNFILPYASFAMTPLVGIQEGLEAYQLQQNPKDYPYGPTPPLLQ